MGTIFPNPLATDGVDKFNYKWITILLFLLSIIALIIPQHPMFQEVPMIPPANLKPLRLPKVKATCMGAEEYLQKMFTGEIMLFANSFCGNAFNEAINGVKSESVLTLFRNGDSFSMILHAESNYIKEQTEIYRQRQIDLYKLASLKSGVRKFVTFQLPLTLILAGICLTIPQLSWAFLSECFCRVNVAKILEQAFKGSRQIKMLKRRGSDTKPCMASILYLIKKFEAIVVVFVLIAATSWILGREADQLEDNLRSHLDDVQSSNESFDPNNFFRSPNDSFICVYHNKVKKQFTVQCTITDIEKVEYKIQPLSESLTNQIALLEFELIIFWAMTGLFIILAMTNVFSFISWLFSLMLLTPSAALGLESDTPMDILLLVQMASINANYADVVEAFATKNDSLKSFELQLVKKDKFDSTKNDGVLIM